MSEILSYKCPNCGGPLKFNPEKQKYACEYCLSEFTYDTAKKEEDKKEADKKAEPLLYTCPSCGAEIVTDETTAASFCYYCHNPVILTRKLSGEFHPDYVIPFSFGKKEAAEIFRQWMKKKRYVPREFYSEDQIEKMSGVYFPYLLYSCRAKGSLKAKAEVHRVWVSGDRQFTETQTFEVVREGIMPVKEVPRNALKKANRELVEGILPYENDKLIPFSMGYLSGFVAERRDMEEKDFSDEIKEEIRSFAVNTLKNSMSTYDAISVQDQNIQLEDESWDYALLPVWTLTYHDAARDVMYYFTINGQTGKVCGKLPVDRVKLLILFLEIFFPICFILLIVGYLI